MKSSKNFVFILLLLIGLFGSSLVKAAAPSDDCETDLDCDTATTFLKCVTKKCQCLTNPPSQWETDDETCRINLGQNCDPAGGTGIQPCTLNSECVVATRKCACTANFGGVSGGTKCAKPFGGDCSLVGHTECDRDNFQRCYTDRCGCNSGTEFYNVPATRCDKKADQACEMLATSQKCARGSTCFLTDTATNIRTCNCDDGFVRSGTDGLCYVKAGQSCVLATNLCNPHDPHGPQVCAHGLCGCANEAVSVLEPTGLCKLAGNATCSFETGAQQCTTHSICDTYDLRCRCDTNKGYDFNSVRRCVIPFESSIFSCTTDADCDVESYHVCGGDKKCTCPMDTQRNEDDGKCYREVLTDCVPTEQPSCGFESLCKPRADGSGHWCVCNSTTLVEGGNGRCQKSFGVSCASSSLLNTVGCSEEHHLDCINDVCQCTPHHSEVINGKTDTVECLGNLGAVCGVDSDCRMEHALTCQLDTVNVKRCSCYVPDEQEYDYADKRCYSMEGGRCNSSAIGGEGLPILCKSGLRCSQQTDALGPYNGRCSGVAGVFNSSYFTLILGSLMAIFLFRR